MCEALRDLMKDEIEKDVNAGIEFGKREGKIEGRREGIISTLYDLIKKGLISIEDAATQAQMSVPAFTAEMKKLG
ncbi:MAG: resolvase [Lachnospiraceae bacterium]|nr:resolvase [Lachnospiraceae bacterium]MBR1650798.1 resolvase [Lachnospiraceae bacterium]